MRNLRPDENFVILGGCDCYCTNKYNAQNYYGNKKTGGHCKLTCDSALGIDAWSYRCTWNWSDGLYPSAGDDKPQPPCTIF